MTDHELTDREAVDYDNVEADLGATFAEAEYQMRLLYALEDRAERLERLSNIAAAASVGLASALGLAALATIPGGRNLLVLGSPISAAAAILALLSIIAFLGALLLRQRERARLQLEYLRAEKMRLANAIDHARSQLAVRREEVGK